MLRAVQPDIDNIACANHLHGPFAVEAAEAGVKVIVLEKPPVIWPGYAEGRTAGAATRKRESMGIRSAGIARSAAIASGLSAKRMKKPVCG